MPTSGEARIHSTSSYNLRSKPLPRTKQASVANKENVLKTGETNSRIPTRKSKLPISSSRKPPISSSSGSTSGTKKSQTKVRNVPNFEKLHKNWQKKFQQGKAVTKKPCTRAREFDLTRPGSHFKRAYYSGDDHTDTEDEFEADQDALQSILDNRGLGNDVITGRSTVATMGDGRSHQFRAVEHRQTLGALPTHNNAYNKSSAAKTPRQAMGFSAQRSKPRKKSLADEQQLDGIEFETDDAALATILNDVGIQPTREYNGAMTRQTIASTHARTFQRASIYYQPEQDRDINKVYEDFARQTIGGALSPTVLKIREFALSQTLPKNLTASPHHSQSNQLHRTALFNNAAASGRHTPGRSITRPKTPGTASRVLNQNVQEQSCSPALRVSRQPYQLRSAMKMPDGNGKGVNRTVCWAEILNSPSGQEAPVTTMDLSTTLTGISEKMIHLPMHEDNLATTLFTDEDVQYTAPYSMAKKRQEELKRIEEDTSVNRHKVEEIEAVELQLQREIERLQMAEKVASTTQSSVLATDSAPQPKYPQLMHTSQPNMATSQPQYIGQPAPVQTMPQSVFNFEQMPSQRHHFVDRDQGVYATQDVVSQSYPVSSKIENPSTRSEMYPMTLPGVSAYNAPTHNMDVPQQSQHVQLPQTSSIQRQHVVTSGPQQKPLANSPCNISYNSFLSNNLVHNTSEPRSNRVVENQKPESSAVEKPTVGFTASSHMMTQPGANFSYTSQVMETRSSQQNFMLQNRVNGTLPSAANSFSRQFPSQLQASSLPSGTQQTTTTSMMHSGLSTVYGMPGGVVRTNPSQSVVSALPSAPLTSAFVGGSPVQPVAKYVVEPKPAVIQTPHPVKPEHHFKHRVMKQYTPAVQSMQRPIITDIPIPIQTPMAMRNITLQGQKSGVKGHIVSPIPQIPIVQTGINESHSQEFSDEYSLTTGTLEPKLKLDFDGVEDTPSVSVGGIHINIGANNYSSSSVSQEVRSSEQQSIDTLTPGMRLKGQWNKNIAGQLFHETLLDEECALYTCRLQSKFAPKPVVDRSHNPVAKILMGGDNMHFVPISDESSANTGRMLPGSAFNTYAWS